MKSTAAIALGPTDDPRALDLQQRRTLKERLAADQERWRARLTALVEPPAPDDDFPAFLLATPPFAALRQAIGGARHARDLPLPVREELQWFVDRYRDYLRTTAGECCFAPESALERTPDFG